MSGRIPEHAYIGFGSNLGDREQYFRLASQLLSQNGIVILRESSLYETEPWGGAEGGPFLNAVIETQKLSSPMACLQILQKIERTLGRERAYPGSARTCDLDILLWGNDIVATTELKVPHPMLHHRKFVLEPLSELIPSMQHPLFHVSFSELLNACEDTGTVRAVRETVSP